MSYIPWVKKYNPRTLDSFKDQNINIAENLKTFNNTIFYGQSGVGKTTYINLLINYFYKKEDITHNVLFLNASDERGINTVRNKIKIFAKRSIYKKYKFKIIVLDEADSLTYEAQTALRRIIEVYSKTTRFCFICNYENKIILPIKSRCNMIKFNKFSLKYIKTYLLNILKEENLKNNITESYLDIILEITNGDLRKSIIYLETITKIKTKNILTKEQIYNLFGLLNEDILKSLLEDITFKNLNEKVEELEFYSFENINYNMINIILNNMDINIEAKSKYIILLAEIDNIKNQDINYKLVLFKILSEYIILLNK